MKRIIRELRDRGVLRAAGLYIAITWLLLQLGDVIFPAFDIPDSALAYILFGAIAGFPFAMAISWFYDISAKGIRSEDELIQSGERKKGSLLSTATVILLGLALLISLAGNYRQAKNAGPQAAPATLSVLIPDFANTTGEPELGHLLAELLAINIASSRFISVYPRLQASGMLKGQAQAMELAGSKGISLLLQGDISASGSGFLLSLQAISPADGEIREATEITAESADELLRALAALARELRTELGESFDAELDSELSETLLTTSLEAAKHYVRAQSLKAEANYGQAAEAYAKSTAADPALGRAWTGAALTAQQLGKTVQSAQLWEQAMALLENMPASERYRTLGLFYTHAEPDTPRAIENYSLLLEQLPADTTARGQLADLYFHARQFERALQQVKAALVVQPGNSTLLNQQALYAMQAGEFALASETAQAVLKDEPDKFTAYLPLAIGALASADFAAAENYYQKMAATNQQGAWLATLGRADMALLRGDYAKAAELLRDGRRVAVELGNNAGAARQDVYQAVAEYHAGNAAKARVLLVAAIAASTEVNTLLPAGLLAVELGEIEQALQVKLDLRQRVSQAALAAADIIEGELALAQGNAVAATDAFNSALARSDNWLAHYSLGRAYLSAGYYAEALGELQKCEDRLGEAAAFFLDGVPTFHITAPLNYQLAINKQRLGMAKPALQSYQSYLEQRVKSDNSVMTEAARQQVLELAR